MESNIVLRARILKGKHHSTYPHFIEGSDVGPFGTETLQHKCHRFSKPGEIRVSSNPMSVGIIMFYTLLHRPFCSLVNIILQKLSKSPVENGHIHSPLS